MQLYADQAVQWACIALLLTAAYTDFSRRIIPNALIVAGVCSGLVYHLLAATSLPQGFMTAISGLLAGGLLLIIPYGLSWTGAGDVKLLAALGTWLGPVATIKVFICATLVGGIMALTVTLRYGFERPYRPRDNAEAGKHSGLPAPGLPYALAMGGGYLLFLAWENFR